MEVLVVLKVLEVLEVMEDHRGLVVQVDLEVAWTLIRNENESGNDDSWVKTSRQDDTHSAEILLLKEQATYAVESSSLVPEIRSVAIGSASRVLEI
ncbi:hypothetical protein Tco_1038696 [Tanacetum coccineum]